MSGPGTITVRPNPIPAGGEVEVTISGTPPLSFRFANTPNDWERLDFKGGSRRVKLRVPPGATFLFLSDLGDPAQGLAVEVVDPGSGRAGDHR